MSTPAVPEKTIDELDAAICRLARGINAESYRFLLLVREFDDRFGWVQVELPQLRRMARVALRAVGVRCARARARGSRAARLARDLGGVWRWPALVFQGPGAHTSRASP